MSQAAGSSATAGEFKVPPLEKIRFNITEPNKFFTGRSGFIDRLHRTITEKRDELKANPMKFVSQIVIVEGITGIGKTETLRKYLQRFGSLYDHIVWITRDTRYLEVFKELSQKISRGLEKPDCIQDVYSKLCLENQKLILVLDNVSTQGETNGQPELPREIMKMLPGSFPHPFCPPVILISSKFHIQLHSESHLTDSLTLYQWKYEESSNYIRKALTKPDMLDNTDRDIAKLVNIFGRYPSVLSLVVRAIKMECKPHEDEIKDFLAKYKAEGISAFSKILFKHKSDFPLGQWEKLELIESNAKENGPFAVHILKLASCLSSSSVSTLLLRSLFTEEVSKDPLALRSALNLLQNHGCIIKGPDVYHICQDIQDAILQLPQSVPSLTLGLVNEELLTVEQAQYLETVSCYEDEFTLKDLSRRLRDLLLVTEKSNPLYQTVIAIATGVASRTFNKALARQVPSRNEYTGVGVNWIDRIRERVKINSKYPLSDGSLASLALDLKAIEVREKYMGIQDSETFQVKRKIEYLLKGHDDPVQCQGLGKCLPKSDTGASTTPVKTTDAHKKSLKIPAFTPH